MHILTATKFHLKRSIITTRKMIAIAKREETLNCKNKCFRPYLKDNCASKSAGAFGFFFWS